MVTSMNSLTRTIVAGLAGTRLIRAWHYEAIGEKPREAVLEWADRPVMFPGRNGPTDEVDTRATARREWLGDLLDCPHCAGVWVTVLCSLGLRWRWARPIIEGLAGSMILSIFVQWYPGYDFTEPEVKPQHVVIDDETSPVE